MTENKIGVMWPQAKGRPGPLDVGEASEGPPRASGGSTALQTP